MTKPTAARTRSNTTGGSTIPTSPLKDLVIAVSGTFPGYKQADLRALVEKNGGSFASSITDGCTHLVTTEREVGKKGSKYQQALKQYNCHIVALEWLIESDEAQKPLPESKYGFGDRKNGDADKSTKKRSLDDALDMNGTSKKKSKSGQTAGSKPVNVAVDEASPHRLTHQVYIDDTGLIWDATLNQTNATANNNKFYRIQILTSPQKDFAVWTRWGRVGEYGQGATIAASNFDAARAQFEKKFKDKSGLAWDNRLATPKAGKYTFIEKNYAEDSDDEESAADDTKKKKNGKGAKSKEDEEKPVESTLAKPIQNLMSFIFNQQHFLSTMASMSYDAQKLPLGKLSKRTLKAGYQILKNLSELVADPSIAATKYNTSFQRATEDLSNSYFTTIPHVFGRHRPPVLNSEVMIKKEVELLEALTDMELANEIMKGPKDAERINILDRHFQGLGMEEMTPLDHASTEFIELENYLNNSKGSTHYLRYSIIDIFRIERKGETERFQNSPYATLPNSNRRLLWHGSRSTNFGGILSQGLRIAPPEAPVSGYMFGKGVYFADMSSKSANYCYHSISANMGLLLLCDVELGDPMLELMYADFNADSTARSSGRISTLGKGNTAPPVWKDAGCVHESLKGVKMPDVTTPPGPTSNAGLLYYNEYIVYDVAQIRQKYLFHVHMS